MAALDYSAILVRTPFSRCAAATGGATTRNNSQYPSDEPLFTDYRVYLYQEDYGGTYWDWNWEQHSDNAEAIITQHADDFIKGDHEFRFGVQYNRGGGSTKPYNPDWYYQVEYESYYYPGYYYTYQYWYTGLPVLLRW